jgi:uncharacterized protein YuzE
MEIIYNNKTDLLYLRLDKRKQKVINKRVFEYMVLDVGKDEKIVGLEIQNASTRLNLSDLLPVTAEVSTKSS